LLALILLLLLLLSLAVLGYQDKSGTYLPPYNWWAESAAKHMVDEINKFYKGTGFQFYLQQVSCSQLLPFALPPGIWPAAVQ
jgi:hypothetical protein